jgi:hypothetical protein
MLKVQGTEFVIRACHAFLILRLEPQGVSTRLIGDGGQPLRHAILSIEVKEAFDIRRFPATEYPQPCPSRCGLGHVDLLPKYLELTKI